MAQPSPHEANRTEPEDSRRPVVRVRGLAKRFRREDGAIVPAVDNVSFDVYEGEFLVLLGPSGCGKTTLLRSIAGLEEPDSGTIEIGARTVFSSEEGVSLWPEKRNLSMIFQSYALWPHMTAYKNIAYPLQSRKVPKSEIDQRIRQVVDLVGVSEVVHQYPGQMSGGQQQRIALARAIVSNDPVILFDEPLSNVDAKVREQVRLQLLSLQRELKFAAIYVTHDQGEAMELADRIAVMERGVMAQISSPSEIYLRPQTRYVANFVGKTNEVEGRIVGLADNAATIHTELGELRVPTNSLECAVGDAVVVFCRPEDCRLSQEEPSLRHRWQGVVEASLFMGPYTEHVIQIGSAQFRVFNPQRLQHPTGSQVWVSVDDADLRVLKA